jgi:hypothetical protein
MCGGNGEYRTNTDPNKKPRTVGLVCGNCGYQFEYPIDCGDRTCPECNKRRKRDIINRLKPIVETMKDPHFLTLTVRRRDLNRKNIKALRNSFTKLRHREIWISVFGGFYNIELGTLRDDGTCNMHIHALYDGMDLYYPYLSWVWSQVTGGSFIVDIQRCWNSQGALHYIAKHFCKIGKFEGEASRELINKTMKNTRLVQGFGNLKRLPPKELSECPECHAQGSFYSCHDPLYYDILSSFECSGYALQPA